MYRPPARSGSGSFGSRLARGERNAVLTVATPVRERERRFENARERERKRKRGCSIGGQRPSDRPQLLSLAVPAAFRSLERLSTPRSALGPVSACVDRGRKSSKMTAAGAERAISIEFFLLFLFSKGRGAALDVRPLLPRPQKNTKPKPPSSSSWARCSPSRTRPPYRTSPRTRRRFQLPRTSSSSSSPTTTGAPPPPTPSAPSPRWLAPTPPSRATTSPRPGTTSSPSSSTPGRRARASTSSASATAPTGTPWSSRTTRSRR
jgi:hypothetical protein